jgi:hypothetical protein
MYWLKNKFKITLKIKSKKIICRLEAQASLENPEGLCEVDSIDVQGTQESLLARQGHF